MKEAQEVDWKARLKTHLSDESASFSLMELCDIIDKEFFDDNNPMDTELIDMVAHRLARMLDETPEDMICKVARAALLKALNLQTDKNSTT